MSDIRRRLSHLSRAIHPLVLVSASRCHRRNLRIGFPWVNCRYFAIVIEFQIKRPTSRKRKESLKNFQVPVEETGVAAWGHVVAAPTARRLWHTRAKPAICPCWLGNVVLELTHRAIENLTAGYMLSSMRW